MWDFFLLWSHEYLNNSCKISPHHCCAFFKPAFNSLSNSKASHYSVQSLCHMHSSYSASAYSTSPLISCFSLCLTCLPTPLCLLAVESHPVVFQACRREPANMQMICAEYPVPIEIDRLGLQWTMPAALPWKTFMQVCLSLWQAVRGLGCLRLDLCILGRTTQLALSGLRYG